MDDFLILMLFTYPGAISYFVYTKLAQTKTFYTKIDSFSRAALCFFMSTATTVCSLLLVSGSEQAANLTTLVERMKTTRIIWCYLIVSFLVSIGLGVGWFLAKILLHMLRNRIKAGARIAPNGLQKKIWAEFIAEYNTTDCAAIIRRGGRFVRAGLPEILPDEITEDKGLFLSRCDRVEAEYNAPNHGLLGNHVMSYYDLSTDTEIEFVSSIDLNNVIRKEEAADH